MKRSSSEIGCPFCLEKIDSAEPATVCPSCGTLHHKECWQSNGGCCLRDCRQVSRNVEIEVSGDQRGRVVLSREAVESARPRRPASNPCMKCGRQVPEGQLHCAECTPEPEESADARNLGPVLLMIAVMAVLLSWLIVGSFVPGITGQDKAPPPPTHNVETDR